MFTATKDVILPATVTGSWPRPSWYDVGMWGRPLSECMLDPQYRERLTDAISVVISDQERAGLDILTFGDYHLDADLAGLSWLTYPLERWSGLEGRHQQSETTRAKRAVQSRRPGTALYEIYGAWRWPRVAGAVEPGASLEFDKIWRIAQARTDRPVKFGTVSAQCAASAVDLATDVYSDDKRQLIWDMASAMNHELRRLVAAGCRVIQIEDPLIHYTAKGLYRPASGKADAEFLDFLVEAFNREVQGLDEAEIWIHACWGNPSAQRIWGDDTSYEEAVELYLERLDGDVWAIEAKDNGQESLPFLAPYRGRMRKKVAIGAVSHRNLQADAAEDVADEIRRALEHMDPESLVLTSDCGFGRQGMSRLVAFYKSTAIAQGANIVRRELGFPETEIRAADPALQIDVVG
jgi:5-methyltetrahydropteroyltriglutamate--homocysteine methyltransferase